ncbi:olfactory receptor 2AP1-like [Emydura macquarii macquarii]|uniref:olfactory receptor 2AP1-like n=1 Tax=Emydura macquarii macquarii TaxID=1129001 RepID=UPI00352AC65A
MATTEWGNQTSILDVILLGFGNLPELQICLFLLFLVIYIMSVSGNTLIVVLVVADQHLHTPMYFFLGNLSCLETCYSFTILPRMLASLLTGDRTISFRMCILQYYFFAFLVSVECYLLSVMSYDQYLAICKPLHYTALMNSRFCLQLAAGSWISGLLASSTMTSLISQLSFCGPNEVDHFMCDTTPVKKLSCSDTSLVDTVTFILASIIILPPFLLNLVSYVCIIPTILRVPSTTRRQKAFSTCSSHLIVVTLFYGAFIIMYVLPDINTLRSLTKCSLSSTPFSLPWSTLSFTA